MAKQSLINRVPRMLWGVLAGCAGFSLYVVAASVAVPEAVQKVTTEPDRVVLTLQTGTLELRPLGDAAIRVRYWRDKAPDTAEFVLTGRTAPRPRFSVETGRGTVTVATTKLRAVIERRDGTLRFQDASGQTFLAEKSNTRRLTPVTPPGASGFTVEQSFACAADEHLYGLGQYQDGLWDWRGMPLEMRQLNTQIAVPMLVSSKGYGLLWENASRTDFNPPSVSEQVALDLAQPNTGQGPTATEGLGDATARRFRGEAIHRGTFTTDGAGAYVFCTRDGDRRNDIAIFVAGKHVAGVTNTWTPRAVMGTISLPAHTTVPVTVRGGGNGVKLFARRLRTDTTTFRSDVGTAVDYTVFHGPKWDDVIAGYRSATGQAPLWPKWAYGLWQCRERYASQQQLLDTAAEFRRRRIPVDLLVQDWLYWGDHGWGSYEWDATRYPDPAAMIRGLHEQNIKFMISVWCNPQGKTREELDRNQKMVGGWIDVYDPQARAIRWKHLNDAFFSIGTDGWWGDATEPGDPGTDLLGKTLSLGAGDQFTSAYPLFASQSIYEGQRAAAPTKRVCILTRSAFPGQQRYGAAAWSGDINGDWETFRRQIPAGLNFCLTGMPYWTTDCGGFFRPSGQYNSADYNELLARWFEWSTFCPILRTHGYGTETEMWKWLPETQKVLLEYDRLRYRMLPYNYSVAWKVTHEGYTILRALGMDFPADTRAGSRADEYLFGPSFLVAPVTTPRTERRDVYLPRGTTWIDFWTGAATPGGRDIAAHAPLQTLPLFVRAGSIVPLGPDVQYANEKPADPLELRVYPGADGAFVLYEDEGDGYAYEHGTYATIPLTWNNRKRTLMLGERAGSFPGMLPERTFRVVLVAPGQGIGIDHARLAVEVRYDGHRRSVALPLTANVGRNRRER